MIVAIAYCHADLTETIRLLRWLRWLKAHGQKVIDRLLIIPSRVAAGTVRHRTIAAEARAVARHAYCFVPQTSVEEGWPKSANFMFNQALCHVRDAFPHEDMLWIEPDAVPTNAAWFGRLGSEWTYALQLDKTFLGGFVHMDPGHMTGNGFYGARWPVVAPMLAEVHDGPWDVACHTQINEKTAGFTGSIQHSWTRLSGHGIQDANVIRPDVHLFHQDKTGNLIRFLDQKLFDGALFDGKTDIVERIHYMTKYFLTQNATRKPVALGIEFTFSMLENFGGSWRGLYATDKEQEIIALGQLCADPPSGITEITKEEYEFRLKKKPSFSVQSPQIPSKPVAPAVSLDSRQGVVRAAESPFADNSDLPQSPNELPKDIEEVIKLGKVEQMETVAPLTPPTVKQKRKRKADAVV